MRQAFIVWDYSICGSWTVSTTLGLDEHAAVAP
jgi:hypothetical protein